MRKITRLNVSWIDYPTARREEVYDEYHGVKIHDPYRWMEDEPSNETQAWVKEQEGITERFFEQIPEREKALTALRKRWLEDGLPGSKSVPIQRGGNTFYLKSEKGKAHNILYLKRGERTIPEVVFDLNQQNPDGLLTIAGGVSVSPKGRYVGYFLHYAGADFAQVHFYDVEKEAPLVEVLPSSYYTQLAWLPDETGFYYNFLAHETMLGETAEKAPGIYWHEIGTLPEQDVLVYECSWEGYRAAAPYISSDGENLLISDVYVMGARGGWGVRPVKGNAEVTWLLEREVAHRFAFVGTTVDELYLITDYKAPNWRIVALRFDTPGLDALREVVSEKPQPISVLAGTNIGQIQLHQDHLYVTYIDHNAHIVKIFDLDGNQTGEISLPELCQVYGIETVRDEPVMFLGITSFMTPPSIYQYSTKATELVPYDVMKTPSQFAGYEAKSVFYTSKDGTRIPMTIIQRKGMQPDGKTRVFLYGYGGWGIATLPSYSNAIPQWLEMGGIYAIANLRGGNEYGDAWHQAGQFYNKQNVFDDFCAAAEYLVAEGYTTHSRISIMGASNGGLLTAACYNQRPELFGAVISVVAVVDLLRMPDTPIGETQTMELGAPRMGVEMFEYLLSYSPLHNVKQEGNFPPILNVVGENDPRCKPGHIYKYVAELQREGNPDRLVLLRLIHGAGHGTSNQAVMLDHTADMLAFAWMMTED